MNLDENRLAVAFGTVTALLWVICSASVALMPGAMMAMTGHMFHASMEGISWTLTWPGFLLGLVAWVVWAAVAGWLIGWCYNRLGRSGTT